MRQLGLRSVLAALALLASAFVLGPGAAAADGTGAGTYATGCTTAREVVSPGIYGGVARCESGRFRVRVWCQLIEPSPILVPAYATFGPEAVGPGESRASCAKTYYAKEVTVIHL